jgi:plasmid maintenance system antidote protein VapI
MAGREAPVEVWMLCKGGALLQSQILAANTTQRGLANAINRSHGLIGQICSGQRRSCSPETAHLICAALGVKLDLLFWPESSNDIRRNANEKLAERKHRVVPRTQRGRGLSKPKRAA